jgi:hypothetical protein
VYLPVPSDATVGVPELAVAVGEADGLALVGGGVVGGGVVGGGVVVGGGEPVAPLQVTPLSAKLAGTGLLEVHEPLKPNSTMPPVATAPLYETFVAVTADPLWATVAFQA